MATNAEYGAFVQTTNIYNYPPKVGTMEFYEFLTHLSQNINNISLLLNIKDSGYYVLSEFVNGQLFFPDPAATSLTAKPPVHRQVYRKVFNFGPLPDTATKTMAHGLNIDANFSFTRIYGVANDTKFFSYIPLPFPSGVLNETVKIWIDVTNINVTTYINRTNYTTTYIILEYIKY